MNKRLLTISSYAVLVGLLLVTSVGWYTASVESSSKDTDPVKEKTILTLPTDINASDVSSCRDGHGVHFSRPSEATSPDKPWGGPTYLYWPTNGQVAAIEYHFKESEVKIPRTVAGSINSLTFDLKGANYEGMTFTYQPAGHPSYEVPHFDVHLYQKTEAERAAFKCPTPTSTSSAVRGAVDNFGAY